MLRPARHIELTVKTLKIMEQEGCKECSYNKLLIASYVKLKYIENRSYIIQYKLVVNELFKQYQYLYLSYRIAHCNKNRTT